ncbi:MAG: response regulator transcription factor [Chloroflexi bacterium]|nr:response regulator transcription factor [Chloroflexota bacterium]
MANRNRLLLIEDDFDVAEMLLMYFQTHQYDVVHAESGQMGIELARTRFPTLVLLDVMLPDMDGYEVCLQMRQSAFTRYIPVIFLTQRDERASKVRGLELGADDYITKPFDIDELRLRVQGSIKRATRESLHEARTGLPTGPLIDEEIERTKLEEKPFQQLTLELAGFQAYREVYGFMAADEVFGYAARAIQTILSQQGTPNDFVGVRDNQFVILSHLATSIDLLKTIQAEFNQGVAAFYSYQDAERGGLSIKAGGDDEQLIPLMSLTPATDPEA